MKYFIGISFTLTIFLTSSLSYATLYKYVDEDGNVSYSQAPPKSGNYKTIKVKKFKPVAPDAASKSLKAKESFAKGAKQREENDLVKAEQQKNEKILKENCAIAKKNLRLFTIFKRLKNEKGEYYRVTDTERAQRIAAAKENIKQFCK